MSFEFPANLERDIQRFAQAEHISPTDAAVRLIQDGLKAKKRRTVNEVLVTDEQIRQLKALDPLFGLLEDVPKEQIDRMAASIQRMKRERFPSRA
jgi:hypothetical protein